MHGMLRGGGGGGGRGGGRGSIPEEKDPKSELGRSTAAFTVAASAQVSLLCNCSSVYSRPWRTQRRRTFQNKSLTRQVVLIKTSTRCSTDSEPSSRHAAEMMEVSLCRVGFFFLHQSILSLESNPEPFWTVLTAPPHSDLLHTKGPPVVVKCQQNEGQDSPLFNPKQLLSVPS